MSNDLVIPAGLSRDVARVAEDVRAGCLCEGEPITRDEDPVGCDRCDAHAHLLEQAAQRLEDLDRYGRKGTRP